MRLYHGTNEVFNDIELGKSRKGKDFGLGFYLTPSRKIAQDQADKKAENFGGDLIVYAYDIDEVALTELKVLRFDCNDYTTEWAQFIRSNRQNRTRQQLHDYDVVIGPIANDTVGYQIRRLEDGIISQEQFLQEIKYHHITVQFMFGTAKALKLLKKI